MSESRTELRKKKVGYRVTMLADALSLAWVKYAHNFDVEPRGTPKQLAALIELAGGEKMLTNLYGRTVTIERAAMRWYRKSDDGMADMAKENGRLYRVCDGAAR